MGEVGRSLKYRPEIDGLRAIAVLMVLFYHAGFVTFKGGYIGVDVFFVLSGYLITKIIDQKIHSDDFSFSEFLARRFKRLTPALICTLSITSVLAWLVLPETHLASFGASLMSVGGFASNIWFWKSQNQYFATESELLPLLHTWSLGVEEQFYLLYPTLLLFLSRRIVRFKIYQVLIFFSICSFLISLYVYELDSQATFFLLPFRSWQLLVGGVIALLPNGTKISLRLREFRILPFAMLLFMIACSILLGEDQAGPQAWSVVPVLSAGILLLYYSNYSVETRNVEFDFCYKFLSLKFLVYIGVLSYPLYLWHQPVFALCRNYFGELGWWTRFGLIVISFVLSGLTHRFVEVPSRKIKWKNNSSAIVAGLSFSLVCIAVGATFYLNSDGDSSLTHDQKMSLDRGPSLNECIDFPLEDLEKILSICTVGSKGLERILVVGDSHAYSLKEGLVAYAYAHNVRITLISRSSCEPLPGIYFVSEKFKNRRKNCESFNQSLAGVMKKIAPSIVLAVGKWEANINGGNDINVNSLRSSTSLEGRREALYRGLANLKSAATENGARFYVLEQIPRISKSPEQILTFVGPEALLRSEGAISRNRYLEFRLESSRILKRVADENVLDPIDVLCDSIFCHSNNQSLSYYFDKHHLSQYGAKFLVEKVFQQLDLR